MPVKKASIRGLVVAVFPARTGLMLPPPLPMVLSLKRDQNPIGVSAYPNPMQVGWAGRIVWTRIPEPVELGV
jgi:hypothetical protein